MCSCQDDIEQLLLERFKSQAPGSRNHAVRLTGYTLILGEKIISKGCMAIEQTAEHPLKRGGYKTKTERLNMVFTFCPFCGKRYESEGA